MNLSPDSPQPERQITDESLPCPEFACTLTLGEHTFADDYAIDGEQGDVWHFDEIGRAGWPGPDGRFPDRQRRPIPEVEPQGFYPPYELRRQQELAELHREWVRPDWLSSVADMDFDCFMLGSPAPFSGDLRPRDRKDLFPDIAHTEAHRLRKATLDSQAAASTTTTPKSQTEDSK